MTWSAPVRTAIAECCEGAIGSFRPVTAAKFLRGTFAGQTPEASRALELQTSTARHRFDVQIGALEDNASTPISSIGSRRIAQCAITIRVTSKLTTQNQADQRATDIEAILDDCEMAARALARPGNLYQTAAAESTGIIGGCLRGGTGKAWPRVVPVSQDWHAQTAITHIEGEAVIDFIMAPLDALSASAKAALVYAHWAGGQLLSSYTGPWGIARRSDTGATTGYANVEALRTWGDGSIVTLSETRDQSGNANHMTSTSTAAQGRLLAADGTPYTTADGSLGYLLPDRLAPSLYVPAYTVSGSLGLPLDSSAFELWYDMHRGTSDEDGVYPITFTKDQDYPNQSCFYNSAFNYTDLYDYSALGVGRLMPADTVGGLVYLGFEALSDAYVRVVKPAAAGGATVYGYVDGVATGLFDDLVDAGTLTLAGTTETGLYAERVGMLAMGAFLVFSGSLSTADATIVENFLAGLVTA